MIGSIVFSDTIIKIVNYFKVVCLHNSQDFITMCPVKGSDNLPHIDLNYMKEKILNNGDT